MRKNFNLNLVLVLTLVLKSKALYWLFVTRFLGKLGQTFVAQKRFMVQFDKDKHHVSTSDQKIQQRKKNHSRYKNKELFTG